MNADVEDANSSLRRIRWYRTSLDKDQFRRLTERSDALGGLQTGFFLGTYALTATCVLYGALHWSWYWVMGCLFLHGMITAFCENAMHEFSHGTVFQTNTFNSIFIRVISFLGFLNFVTFTASHTRHHAYTLHPPNDLEVVLPMRLTWRDFLLQGFVDFDRLRTTIADTIRIARGKFKGRWELITLPEGDLLRRRDAMHWARVLLVGHVTLFAASMSLGWWLVPVVITLAPFYGGWLFWLCNNTQHIGMQDNVPDFRLSARSFKLNPLVTLFYWHMQYHVEHHMYPGVPCYRLSKLNRAIAHDLPLPPDGIVAAWREIALILRRQSDNPKYRHFPAFPPSPGPQR